MTHPRHREEREISGVPSSLTPRTGQREQAGQRSTELRQTGHGEETDQCEQPILVTVDTRPGGVRQPCHR